MDIRLDPYVQIAGESIAVVISTRRDLISARITLVDIMLRDGCPDHSSRTGHETPEDLLERRELDTDAGEEGIELHRTVRRSDPGQDGEGRP